METRLAAVVAAASLFCSSAQAAVVIQPNTTATFQFSDLPLSQPNALQVDPAAGHLDLGATVLPGQNLISLFGDPGDATPFHQTDWFTFDGTGFNPDAWFDETGAVSLMALGGPINISHFTAGWVGRSSIQT